jgi:hypothetical protein
MTRFGRGALWQVAVGCFQHPAAAQRESATSKKAITLSSSAGAKGGAQPLLFYPEVATLHRAWRRAKFADAELACPIPSPCGSNVGAVRLNTAPGCITPKGLGEF